MSESITPGVSGSEYYAKYPDKTGYLLLPNGEKHENGRGIACPNSKGMRTWHCPETSLSLGWHIYNHITHNQLTKTVHCFQCMGILGEWIVTEEEE
ncbi:MAG: hypothetical protein CXT67_00260 [Methanobacteriota archaeon]|nr:MAG: hypothetical protein CXT67_00260 [Euryarchaeota archaeon]